MNYRINWIAFVTIIRKEIYRFMRIWPQTIFPVAITMSLYFAIFGKLIGSRIGQVDGVDYILFIVPGLIMMAVITNTYANVSSSFHFSKMLRELEGLLVAPVANITIILAYALGAVARGLLIGSIVILVSLFFTDIYIASPLLMLLVVFLSSFLFALAGLANAVFAKTVDDISFIPTFVLTPLTYLGGVFFSIDMLAQPWQSLAWFNPILYIVRAFRYCMLGISEVSVWGSLGIIITFIIGLLLLNLYLFRYSKGIRG